MKTIRFYLFLLSIFCCITTYAQTIIEMEEHNGVYRIPCIVNGAKMKFVFDTGASNVCISMPMAEYLFDNGYIDKEDILGSGSSTVADGRIVDHVIINIKDIEIKGFHLTNVRAVVIEGQNAPLLMGQSAIQKLGSIELNGNILTIKSGNSNSEEYIDNLFTEAFKAMDNSLYAKAAENFSKLYSMNQLSDYGLYQYALACYFNSDKQRAEELLDSIKDFAYFESKKIDVYSTIAHVKFGLEKYNEAANYYELSNKKIHTDPAVWVKNIRNIADCYYFNGNISTATEKYRLGAYLYGKINNIDIKYLQRDSKNQLKRKEVSYRCDDIDYLLFQLFLCNERTGAWSSEAFLFEITAMARANNKYAMRYLNNVGINPYDDCWK